MSKFIFRRVTLIRVCFMLCSIEKNHKSPAPARPKTVPGQKWSPGPDLTRVACPFCAAAVGGQKNERTCNTRQGPDWYFAHGRSLLNQYSPVPRACSSTAGKDATSTDLCRLRKVDHCIQHTSTCWATTSLPHNIVAVPQLLPFSATFSIFRNF